MFDFPSVRVSQTDDSSNAGLVNASYVVQPVAFRNERDDSKLVVLKSIVDPNQCLVPLQSAGDTQRQPVFSEVEFVFGRVEIDQNLV